MSYDLDKEGYQRWWNQWSHQYLSGDVLRRIICRISKGVLRFGVENPVQFLIQTSMKTIKHWVTLQISNSYHKSSFSALAYPMYLNSIARGMYSPLSSSFLPSAVVDSKVIIQWSLYFVLLVPDGVAIDKQDETSKSSTGRLIFLVTTAINLLPLVQVSLLRVNMSLSPIRVYQLGPSIMKQNLRFHMETDRCNCQLSGPCFIFMIYINIKIVRNLDSIFLLSW